jgi:SAM-dependent methyltransferase
VTARKSAAHDRRSAAPSVGTLRRSWPGPYHCPVARCEALGIDAAYLREHQYKDPTNLNARIALHVKYSRADEPWYRWLAARIGWPEGAEVLEVGCGSGALWVNIAPLLPHLRLTLTDLSDGMVAAAAEAVASLPGLELAEARTCDAQRLPFADGAARRPRPSSAWRCATPSTTASALPVAR